MIFAAVLAGGMGTRMGKVKRPKQFLELHGKPVLVYTLLEFIKIKEFEEIIVLCPEDWVEYTEKLIREYLDDKRISVISGGITRNETIINSIDHIEKKFGLDKNTVLVTHDAVRPFLNRRVIIDNIKAVKKYGACDTVIPATDTIVESLNENYVSQIPDRSKYYQGQTPQSFFALEFKNIYETLSEDEKEILTDAAKVFVMKGKNVALVKGEVSNIKITYKQDIQLAEIIARDISNEK